MCGKLDDAHRVLLELLSVVSIIYVRTFNLFPKHLFHCGQIIRRIQILYNENNINGSPQ